MKCRGLLNKCLCENKLQLYPLRQKKIVNIHFSHFKSMETRTVRGSDYSPAVELSEQKDKLVTENWRD